MRGVRKGCRGVNAGPSLRSSHRPRFHYSDLSPRSYFGCEGEYGHCNHTAPLQMHRLAEPISAPLFDAHFAAWKRSSTAVALAYSNGHLYSDCHLCNQVIPHVPCHLFPTNSSQQPHIPPPPPKNNALVDQPSALAEKLADVGQSRNSHFSSRLVRPAKFIKGT